MSAALGYVLSGAGQSLVLQQLAYLGAAHPRSMLPVLAVYGGMALSAVIGAGSLARLRRARLSKPLMLSATLDFLAQALCTAGASLAGSSVFQLVNSAVVPATALLARVALGRRIARRQQAAIGLITAGLLAMSTVGGGSSAGPSKAEVEGRVAAGTALSLLGTLIYAAVFVLNEALLGGGGGKGARQTGTSPEEGGLAVGLSASALSLAWLACHTLPRWSWWRPGAGGRGGAGALLALFGALLLLATANNRAYFALLATSGAATVGALNAARSVIVLAASHALWCPAHAPQCATGARALLAPLVLAGVALFAAPPPRPAPPRARASSEE
eukprot:tig00020560_g11095.t1